MVIFCTIQFIDRFLSFCIVSHLDKSESLGFVGLAIRHDPGGAHFAERRKSGPEFATVKSVRQVPHVDVHPDSFLFCFLSGPPECWKNVCFARSPESFSFEASWGIAPQTSDRQEFAGMVCSRKSSARLRCRPPATSGDAASQLWLKMSVVRISSIYSPIENQLLIMNISQYYTGKMAQCQ